MVTTLKADIERPETLKSTVVKVPTGYGNLYVSLDEDDTGRLVEMRAIIGKSGKSITAKAEAISRMVSLALRHDIPIPEIVDQLMDITGEAIVAWKDTTIKSIPDAIAKVLANYLTEKEEKNE